MTAMIPMKRNRFTEIADSAAAGADESDGMLELSGGTARRGLLAGVAMHDAENDRDEDERRRRRENEAADDRTAERRVLFAAFAEAERHRRHADDHRERGHQHRTEAHEARFERGLRRVAELVEPFPRERDHEHAVRGRD